MLQFESMKIAIDARFYGLEHAGLGRYTLNLIHELAKIDHKNHYTLIVWSRHKDLSLPENFKTVVIDAPHHTIREQLALAKFLWEGDFDLVHFPHFIVPVFNFKVPFVVTIHDLIKHKYGSFEATTLPLPIYYAKYFAYKFDMWWAAKMSKHIITPTQAVKDDIVSWFHITPNKITYTHEGVDGNLSHSLEKNPDPKIVFKRYGIKQPYIVYVGNSYPYKNIKTLIQALDYVDPSISLVIVGSRNVFLERLEQQINELGKKDRVILTGYVPDDDLGIVYNQAIAYVTASFEEGFGITPLEAMGVGCPAVVSDIPVFREVCGDAALYFDPQEPQGVASRVQEIYQDENLRSGLIQKGKQRITGYSWNRMAQQTLEIYAKFNA